MGIFEDFYGFDEQGKALISLSTSLSRLENKKMDYKNEATYNRARESFIATADLIFDFVYWAQKQVPQTGFKTIKPGTSKKEIDKIFSNMIIVKWL